MGQLEKYGLYVLCLVIFLILGVTIWGGGELQPSSPRRGATGAGTELSATQRNGADKGAANVVVNRGSGAPITDLQKLLEPVPQPEKKPDPKVADPAVAKPPSIDPKVAVDPGKAGTKPPEVDPAKNPPDTARPVHKVARGETFDSIAKAKLGSSALLTEIAKLNPKVDPSRLQVGQELVLPTAAEVAAFGARSAKKATGVVEASAPAPAKEKAREPKALADAGSYVIARGDTFESIARRELGSGKRVNEVKDLNPDVDPTRLRIGMTIKLPKK